MTYRNLRQICKYSPSLNKNYQQKVALLSWVDETAQVESKCGVTRTMGTVPNSLTKTTVALLLAALAVLVTAGIAMRDFIRDVNAPCPGTLVVDQEARDPAQPHDPRVVLPIINTREKEPQTPEGVQFRLLYESNEAAYPVTYRNVRLEWLSTSTDGPCVCGSIPITLEGAQGPYGFELTFDPRSSQYTLTNGSSQTLRFTVAPTPSHHVQIARILSRRHMSLAVSFAAFLALGVAWLRQRKARAYALTMHAWREVELTSGQMIQSETGEMLGALQSTSRRIWQRAGKVLVAPEALGGSGLYRDVPAIEPRHVARGGHDEWARATMIRLRDARALAILSALTSGIALAAHLLA